MHPAAELGRGRREQESSAVCFGSIFMEMGLLKIHTLILEPNGFAQYVGVWFGKSLKLKQSKNSPWTNNS